jgi:hypothetical protein
VNPKDPVYRAAIMSGGATEVCPWDVDPALKAKRLALLARLAVETRAQALAEADRDAGDTNWGIGCKAHERFAHAVTKLAETTERSWLRVHRDGLSFVSFIEGVAVRAYHGAADRPHARHVYAAQSESHREPVDPRQLALPFAGGAATLEPNERWAWLMAMETDEEGRALRIVFFQANAVGETRYSWVAPVPTEGPDAPRPAVVRSRSGTASAAVRRRPTQLTALV